MSPSDADNTALQTITLHLHTNLSPPLCGSEFVVEIPQSLATIVYGPDSVEKKLVFSSLAELKPFIHQLLSVYVAHDILLPKSPSWEPMDDLPVISRTYQANGKEAKVSIGIKVSEEKIELRRQRLVEGKMVDLEVWSDDVSSSRGVTDVFDAWAEEAKERS